MPEIKPGIPDFIPQFTNELKTRGASDAVIEKFSAHWRDLPVHAPDLPCPVCFTSGKKGKLIPMSADEHGNEAVRCKQCGVKIVVHEGGK